MLHLDVNVWKNHRHILRVMALHDSTHRVILGILRYYGRHAYNNGYRCGVELHAKTGLNNGTIEGFYYFTCPIGHGVLVM